MYISVVVGMSSDIDYILQAIGNEVRRKILLHVARESPISYTKLMKRVGIEDSGTFGFHLRKMQKLLKKDDMGEYVLSDLGRKAIDILEKIGYVTKDFVEKPDKVVDEKKHEEASVRFGHETKVISGMVSYEFNENIARMYREKGVRLIFRDIIKLAIGRMPRELFDEVVEEIDDCLTVHCPNELSDLVQMKSKEVFHIKVANGKRGWSGLSFDLGFIGDIVSGVVSNVLDFVPRLVSKGVAEQKLRLVVDEDYRLDDVADVAIESSGGIAEVYFGEANRLKIWSSRDEPSIDIDRRGDSLVIDLAGDKVELRAYKNDFRDLNIDTSGGMIKVKKGSFRRVRLDVNGGAVSLKELTVSEELRVDLSGGVANLNMSKGKASILLLTGELSGGLIKLEVKVPRGTKVKVDSRHLGGYININRDGGRLSSVYVDPEFDYADSKLEIRLDVLGGYADILIKEG